MNSTVLALDLNNNFSAGSAVVAGLVGAVAMLMVIYGGRAAGMTSMDLLRTLGTMVAPKSTGGSTYAIGLMMHLMMGAGFGLVHAGLLHAAAPTTTSAATVLGLVFGLAHGVIVVAMMPAMLTMGHPLVRSGAMPTPQVAMTGYGKMTPMGMTMAHVVFGLVAGVLYVGAVG